MADICMCSGKDCPIKEKCYRYTAPKNPCWQSYFMEPPYKKETNTCEHYWDRTK